MGLKRMLSIVLFTANTILLFSLDFSRDIKISDPRMHGEDIVELQKRLLSFGFSEIGTADGWYGPKTEAAVRKYQEFYGFKPNGIVTNKLWQVMFSQEKLIVQINNDLKIANSLAIDKYSKTEREFFNRSTEGGSITKYSDSNKVRYIEIGIYGERGKVYYKIYLAEDRYLAIETNYIYPEQFDVEHAEIENAMYYYVRNTTYEIRDGLPTKVKYDSIRILDIINEK